MDRDGWVWGGGRRAGWIRGPCPTVGQPPRTPDGPCSLTVKSTHPHGPVDGLAKARLVDPEGHVGAAHGENQGAEVGGVGEEGVEGVGGPPVAAVVVVKWLIRSVAAVVVVSWLHEWWIRSRGLA